MKLKPGFILREIAGETVVLASGDDLDLNVMITLNHTGKFLWTRLENDTTVEQLVEDVLSAYETDAETAKNTICAFIAQLNDHGFLI